MTGEQMKETAARIVETALSEGAGTAEVDVAENNRFGVTVRNGSIENLIESGSSRIGISVSVDGRKSSATSSDLSEGSIKRMIREAVEFAAFMDRDEYFGLPEPEELGSAGIDLGIHDEETCSATADRKIRLAMELEKIACGLDGRIISDGASLSSGRYSSAFANSIGFCDWYSQTWNSLEISCAAADRPALGPNTGKKQSSYWFSTSCRFSGLEPLESIASRAVERTIGKLGAVKPKTCEVPVIFDETSSRRFFGSISSAVNGGNIYRRASFLADRLGDKISSPLVTLVDDPLIHGAPGSRPFDAEGVRTRKTTVVENGIMKTWLLDSYQARKLSMRTTGSAGGISNFYMKPGDSSLEEMIAGVGEGLLLTELSGPGANWSNGDFSQGGQGIWISGGKLAYPVNEFTIAGSFPQMLSGISAVADRFEWKGPLSSPAFKIDRMTISGT